jgi:hypothetical protein
MFAPLTIYPTFEPVRETVVELIAISRFGPTEAKAILHGSRRSAGNLIRALQHVMNALLRLTMLATSEARSWHWLLAATIR